VGGYTYIRRQALIKIQSKEERFDRNKRILVKSDGVRDTEPRHKVNETTDVAGDRE